jgi:hypothetical protein
MYIRRYSVLKSEEGDFFCQLPDQIMKRFTFPPARISHILLFLLPALMIAAGFTLSKHKLLTFHKSEKTY